MQEVVRAVLGGVPRHPTIVELLNPLGWVRESSAARDSEGGKATVFDIALGWLGEGVDVADESRLEELDHLFTVIQLLLVVRFLGGEVLLEAVGAGLGGDDEPIDDGPVSVGGKIVTGDGAAD